MKLQDYISKHGNVEIEEKQLNELLGIKESKVWKPKDGEKYWYVCSFGEVMDTCWDDDYDSCDGHLLMGNVYQTKEQAEFELEKRKVEVELQRFAIEHNECEIDWNDFTKDKHFIFYSPYREELAIDCRSHSKANDVYFTSSKIAEQAIKTIGVDRLKKYYFGVED